MELVERFLNYCRMDTTSDADAKQRPSTPGQIAFLKLLMQELSELHLTQIVNHDDKYVTAVLPSSAGLENVPAVGLLAHVDTSEAAAGACLHPQIVPYDGGAVPLGNSGRVLDPASFPILNRMKDCTLITTDGTTLLGGDDKAGIAEIMDALQRIVAENLPHGKLCVAFTTDEETGCGTDAFDVPSFGADFAYTVDDGAPENVQFQNFNAAFATLDFKGVSTHTGSAKGVMKNAARIAMEFNAMLPAGEVPEQTENLEGFFHLDNLSGNVSSARSAYLIRDHNAAKFELRKVQMTAIADFLNRKYGAGTVTISIREQYRNMEEVIRLHPQALEIADAAIRKAGLTPVHAPIRGGTDGATLSRLGLPCPNLGTGTYNHHGELEFACVEDMRKMVQILLNIVAGVTAG